MLNVLKLLLQILHLSLQFLDYTFVLLGITLGISSRTETGARLLLDAPDFLIERVLDWGFLFLTILLPVLLGL